MERKSNLPNHKCFSFSDLFAHNWPIYHGLITLKVLSTYHVKVISFSFKVPSHPIPAMGASWPSHGSQAPFLIIPFRHYWEGPKTPPGTTGDKLMTSDPGITSFLPCKFAFTTGDKLVINWWLVHNWWRSPVRPAGTSNLWYQYNSIATRIVSYLFDDPTIKQCPLGACYSSNFWTKSAPNFMWTSLQLLKRQFFNLIKF